MALMMEMDKNFKEQVKKWTSYYRFYPHKFVEDYFGIFLKPFQKIIIFFMMHFNYTMFIASRGLGKTWLTGVFSSARCVLYPGTKVVIASGVKTQAAEVVEKIADMMKDSPNLAREISHISLSVNDTGVEFHNGSWIKIVASNDNARGKRANLLIIDEFRMVDLDVINTVLRKFNASPRQPGFLSKEKYKNKPEYLERNKEIYLSSAYYKAHWSWTRFLTYLKAMSEGSKYFVCGLPYQIAIKEGLYDASQARDEMDEHDFDPIAWSMEMDAMFYGESSKAFFRYEDLNEVRNIQMPIYPKPIYQQLGLSKLKYKKPQSDEITLLSCDIAVAAGEENDNTVFAVIRLTPGKRGYEQNVVYMETMNGGHTVVQANRIRQLYNDFDCNYVVLDTKGVGFGVYDQLVVNSFDQERGVEYGAWTCINDQEMADRCTVAGAPAVIYSIKASSQFNSAIAFALRDDIRRKRVKLLLDENKARQNLLSMKGYAQLDIETQVLLEAPFKQTSALVNEMINLEARLVDNNVQLKESGSMRKDRYTALAYGNYVARLLEDEYLQGLGSDDDDVWASYARLWG